MPLGGFRHMTPTTVAAVVGVSAVWISPRWADKAHYRISTGPGAPPRPARRGPLGNLLKRPVQAGPSPTRPPRYWQASQYSGFSSEQARASAAL